MRTSLLILFLIITASRVKAQNVTLKSNDIEGQAKMEQVFNIPTKTTTLVENAGNVDPKSITYYVLRKN